MLSDHTAEIVGRISSPIFENFKNKELCEGDILELRDAEVRYQKSCDDPYLELFCVKSRPKVITSLVAFDYMGS